MDGRNVGKLLQSGACARPVGSSQMPHNLMVPRGVIASRCWSSNTGSRANKTQSGCRPGVSQKLETAKTQDEAPPRWRKKKSVVSRVGASKESRS